MNLDVLKFCYIKLDPNSVKEKIEDVKSKLYKLYDHYVVKQNVASTSSSVLTTSSEDRNKSKGKEI